MTGLKIGGIRPYKFDLEDEAVARAVADKVNELPGVKNVKLELKMNDEGTFYGFL